MGSELGCVHRYGHPPFVGRGDDLLQRRKPAGHVGSSRDCQKLGAGALVEPGDHIVHTEGALPAALHIAPGRHPSPGQQVGVMLHDRGEHHIARFEAEPVGEVVDRLGRVPADDGGVAVGPACEPQQGLTRLFVGRRRRLRFVAGAAVDARVPGEELRHAICDRDERGRRRRRVERQIRPLVPVGTGHHHPVAHERDVAPGAGHQEALAGAKKWATSRMTLRASKTSPKAGDSHVGSVATGRITVSSNSSLNGSINILAWEGSTAATPAAAEPIAAKEAA